MRRKRGPFDADTYTVKRASGTSDSFASKAIDIATPAGSIYLRSATTISRSRHQRAWDWFHKIGEVHYAISRGSKIAGYAELGAYELTVEGELSKKLSATSLAGRIAHMLQSPYGGQRGFVERFFEMMKIPGDCYLIRTRDAEGNPNGYDWLSASEIDQSDTNSTLDIVIRPGGQKLRRILIPKASGVEAQFAEIRPEDFLGRVWRPGGQYIEVADSPMQALDLECELLYLLTASLMGKLKNRLAINGMMILAKEIVDVHTSAPKADPDQFHTNNVLNQFVNGMNYAVANPMEPGSALPVVLQANQSTTLKPAEMVALITTDREIWSSDMELRDEQLKRIITGLDVQPQHVRGLGDANHWSAWAVSDDERRVSIQPDLETMCWAVTRLVLNAEMKTAGRSDAEIAKTVIWYDLTKANVKTNLAEDSRQMRDRGLVSEEGSRRMSGIDEADAPTDADRVRMIGVATGNPYLATYGLASVGGETGPIDWDKVAEFMGKKSGPDQESGAEPSKASPSKGAPDKPKGTATPIRKAS